MTIEVSRRTLEEAPQKVLNLLRGFGTCLPAREAVNGAGYSKEAHEEGWALLHAASGYEPGKQSLFATDVVVRDAIVECDRWDEQGLRRILAALNRHHPDQAAFVSENLQPAQGIEAVFGVSRLLGRLNLLEKGRSDETREADQAAIATLASRGITQKERARLAERVKVATSAKMPELAETSADTAAARDQSLRALHAWYTEWSETTRAVVTRRDYLIRLGLSKRRKKSDSSEPTGVPTP